MTQLFDMQADAYERWFQTPIGEQVKATELALILKTLQPQPGEHILDAGCGSAIFSEPLASRRARVTGVDLSLPMLTRAGQRLPTESFLAADIGALPFADGCFDKVVSITALEFIEHAERAMSELFRVVRPGGRVVVATLNRLSPWAERRSQQAERDPGSLFRHAWFRSPDELQALAPVAGQLYTAVHFAKDCDPAEAAVLEQAGEAAGLVTGAFLLGSWERPRT